MGRGEGSRGRDDSGGGAQTNLERAGSETCYIEGLRKQRKGEWAMCSTPKAKCQHEQKKKLVDTCTVGVYKDLLKGNDTKKAVLTLRLEK